MVHILWLLESLKKLSTHCKWGDNCIRRCTYIFATPVWNKAFRESIHENLSVILCWAAWTWPSVKSHPLFCCRISHLILRSDGRGIYRLLVRYYGWHSGQDFKVRNIKSGCSTANIVPRSIFKCDMVILAFDPSTSQILLIYVLFLHNLLQSNSWLRRIFEKTNDGCAQSKSAW